MLGDVRWGSLDNMVWSEVSGWGREASWAKKEDGWMDGWGKETKLLDSDLWLERRICLT